MNLDKTYIIRIKGEQYNMVGYLTRIVRDDECRKDNAWGITNVIWARDISRAMIFNGLPPLPVLHELADYHAMILKRQMIDRGIYNDADWSAYTGKFNACVVWEEYKPESYWNETQ